MSENTEKKVLLTIAIDPTEAIKEIANTKKRINDLRSEQKKLDQSTDDGREMYEAYAAEIRNLTTDLRSQQKQVDNIIKANNAQEDSMEQLKAVLSNLTAEYNSLSKVQRNTPEGEALREQIKGITDELKGVEGGTGNFRRSVGEYQDSILRAIGLGDGFIGNLTQMASIISEAAISFTQMATRAREATTSFSQMATTAREAGTSFGTNLAGGVRVAGKAFLALLANPVVLIIAAIAAALTGLVLIFKKVSDTIKNNEEQSNRLNAALAPLKIIGDALTRVFEKLGDILITIAEGFGKVIGKLADYLGLSKEINQETKDYTKLEKDKARLIEATRRSNENLAKGDLAVSELRAKIAQKDKYSIQERLAFSDKAAAIERKNADDRIKIAKEELRILEIESQRTKNNAEINDKLSQAKINLINAEKAYNDKTRELFSQRSEMINQEIAQRKEAEQRLREIANRSAKALVDIENLKSQTIIDQQNIALANSKKTSSEKLSALLLAEGEQIKILERNQRLELRNKDLTEQERKSIIAKTAYEIQKLRETTETRITEIELQEQDKRLRKEAEVLASKKKQLADEKQNELTALAEQYARKAKQAKYATDLADIETQYEKEKNQIIQKYRESEFNASIDAMQQLLSVENLTAEQRIEIEKSVSEAKSKYAQESADAAIKANEEVSKNQDKKLKEQEDAEKRLVEKKKELYSQLSTTLKDLANGYFDSQNQKIDAETERINQRYDDEIKAAGKNERQKELIEDQRQAKLDELESKKRKLARQQAITERAFAAFSVGLSTTKSVMAALAPPPVGLGPVAGVPLAITTGAIGALQLASVMAQPLPKAQKGKVFRGPSHAQGGIPVEVEGDEIILTKGVYRNPMLRAIASQINQAGGGIPLTGSIAPLSGMYATGGTVNHIFKDGGYAMRNLRVSINKDDMRDAMKEALRDELASMKIYTTIEDIRREDKNYVEIESRANF